MAGNTAGRKWLSEALAEHGIKIIAGVCGAIVAMLGAILWVVLALRGDVSSVQATVSNAKLPELVTNVAGLMARVDAIERAVPEIRLKVALDVTQRAYPVVVATVRRAHPDGHQGASVSVVDLSNGTVEHMELTSKDVGGVSLSNDLTELARSLGSDTVTFTGAVVYWQAAKVDKTDTSRLKFPSFLDGNLSFAVGTPKSPAQRSVALQRFALLRGTTILQRSFNSYPIHEGLEEIGPELAKILGVEPGS